MIEVQDNNDSNTRLIVTANQSMSWKANLYLAASLGVVCMGVAIAMAAYGLWMVIPFAGLEVIFIVLPRRWSSLSYRCADNLFEVGELSLRAHGRQYPVGDCLNREEKKALYGELQAALVACGLWLVAFP